VPIVGILGLVGAGTVIVGGVEASHAARQEVPVVTSAVAETQSTSDQVAAPGQAESEAAAKAKQLAAEEAESYFRPGGVQGVRFSAAFGSAIRSRASPTRRWV
jgi:hypothetical protein